MATMEMLGNFGIGFLMANMTYLLNFRSLGPPYGPEEAPVVPQLGPSHLGEVGELCHWLPCGQYELHATFQISGATYMAFFNVL